MRLDTEFVSSALAMRDCPRWTRTEVAIAGRSNVGKSSLLNALAGRKGLARTSKTPGRTRCLNFFAVDDSVALVDLPGYGYARMPQHEAAKIAALMREYLERRRNLKALVMLIDVRRGPQQDEIALAEIARRRAIQLIVAATKCDKLSNSQRAEALSRFSALGIKPVMCSALSSEGIEELRRRIAGLGKSDPARASAPHADRSQDQDTPS